MFSIFSDSETMFWWFCFMCFPVECFIYHYSSHIVSDTIFLVLQFRSYCLLLGTFFVTWFGQCTKLSTGLSVHIYKFLCLNEDSSLPSTFSYVNYPIIC